MCGLFTLTYRDGGESARTRAKKTAVIIEFCLKENKQMPGKFHGVIFSLDSESITQLWGKCLRAVEILNFFFL